jgi:putative transposase
VCRKHGISSATFYKRKAKCGGLEVFDSKRLKVLEDENTKLKKLLADAMLDNAMLQDVASKNGDAAAEREVVALAMRSASGGRVRCLAPIGPRCDIAAVDRTNAAARARLRELASIRRPERTLAATATDAP